MNVVERKQAKELGLVRYFTGKPCKRGHVAERQVSSKLCMECQRDVVARWRKDNLERERALERAGHHRNKEKRNAYSRDYNRRNRQRLYDYNRLWWKANPEKFNRLANLLRTRLRVALRGNYKTGSAVKDLGCSIEDFRLYIAKQFSVGMSWDNHGTVWQLDHIRPLALFDLGDRGQFLQACHYTNLQPLFSEDHKRKTRAEIPAWRSKGADHARDFRLS